MHIRSTAGFVPAVDGYRQAREAAEKALALDPQHADAHLAMGFVPACLRLGLGGRGRQLSQSTRLWNPATPRPSVAPALGIHPRTLERSDQFDEPGHRARSAATGLPTTTSASCCWQSTVTRSRAEFQVLSIRGTAIGTCSLSSCWTRLTTHCWRCRGNGGDLAARWIATRIHAFDQRRESHAARRPERKFSRGYKIGQYTGEYMSSIEA